MKKFICSFVSSFLVFMSFPLVFAESETYLSVEAGECVLVVNKNNTSGFGSYKLSVTNNSRVVSIRSGSNIRIYAISNNINTLFDFKNTNINDSCYVPTNSQSYTYNNVTYSGYNISLTSNDIQYITVPIMNVVSGLTFEQSAIYYTYGDGAVDPAPPAPVFGNLADVGYNTRIAGSGQSAINNLDTVSWNPETDTSGNDISYMSVSVRVVPGKYSASSRQNLYEKLYTDFILNDLGATVLDTVPVSIGSFSVTWEDVIDVLALPFATVASVIDQDGTFIKNGWIYQVRLEGDNYTGEWQTVFTATSSGVENDLTIIQSTTINQTLVNTITEINQLNNTSNNWYINETTINMSEYTEPSEGDKPWWAYLLEAIVSLISKIADWIASIFSAIADLAGDIIDGILGLFTFDSFSVPDFSTHQQNIHDNSGIFGESIDILQTMNQTISNADSSAEPVLYYPGIDLEGVEFIPEITINLNDYVEDLGLTQWHNLAYTCTDILIWTSLIYTIYRKLIGVFKK